MEMNDAIAALAALAHPARLAVFRLLVRAGPEGVPAGEIARQIGALPNTTSANLNVLNAAGLIASRREGRSILHAADFGRMAALMTFLAEDCCGGRPEICAPLTRAREAAAC